MGNPQVKSIKIKLNNNTASGMYILLVQSEIKYSKDNETKPPNRAYKIELAVEVVHKNKRCRGKATYAIAKGTSISKAVSSLLGKKEEMKNILRTKGTLKLKKQEISKIDTKDRIFKALYNSFITKKKINHSHNTILTYNTCYNNYLSGFDSKVIDDIEEDDVQNLINDMLNKSKSAETIHGIKKILKSMFDIHSVEFNWSMIEFPKIVVKDKFSGDDEEAKLIATTLLEYNNPLFRGVFAFLLTGRRIGELLLMEHRHISYKNNNFTLPKENTKTNTEAIYQLTPALIKAIKIQKNNKGTVFNTTQASVLYHFKKAMRSIGIHNMVVHDIRSMVAVVSLRNGADIYSVSKMLSHKKIATTESRYLNNDVSTSVDAQNSFNDVIDVEVDTLKLNDSKLDKLRILLPEKTDEQLFAILEVLKSSIQ